MNKIYPPGDLILIESTNLVNNDDIVIAIIDDEATCKKINFSPNEIILTPQSFFFLSLGPWHLLPS